MAKQIYQYRYYPKLDTRNQPEDLNEINLVNGTIFADKMPIIQLGIQTLPGVQFYLNGSTNPITIGTTGIYELDMSTEAIITSLRFDYESIQLIKGSQTAYLIIDIVWGEDD